MSGGAKTDPLIVSLMRTWPTGDVRHVPGGGIGMTGTSTRGFLAEYDEALAEAYRRGFDDGYAVACQDATPALPARATQHSEETK